MKLLMNNSRWLCALLFFTAGAFMLCSCEKEELDIQQNYPFEVQVMPVTKEIANGQTVELRLTIARSGNFTGTRYYIRYFQFEGEGELRYYRDAPYVPNDLYPLQQTEFRLYYTSQSPVSQAFDVWISDNFGNVEKLGFQFSNKE
ncbi:MAG: DUF3872 domain-containing protein [Chitinophagaceae bacterium]